MNPVLFAQNLLESPLVTSLTTTVMLAAKPKTRFYNRDRLDQGQASASGQFDVDVVFSSTQAASALGLVNHNVGGAVTIYADTAGAIGSTLQATLAPTAIDPFLGTWASVNGTKWRIRFANFGSALAVGEILLGVPRTITRSPSLRTGAPAILGNIRRLFSPAGYPRGAKKGASRVRLPYAWKALPDADVATLQAAYAEVDEGAKSLLMQDRAGTLRWMFWASLSIEPSPVGNGLNEVEAIFEEALA